MSVVSRRDNKTQSCGRCAFFEGLYEREAWQSACTQRTEKKTHCMKACLSEPQQPHCATVPLGQSTGIGLLTPRFHRIPLKISPTPPPDGARGGPHTLTVRGVA